MELPVATRHRRDMTGKLLKATLKAEQTTLPDSNVQTMQLELQTLFAQIKQTNYMGSLQISNFKKRNKSYSVHPVSVLQPQSFI